MTALVFLLGWSWWNAWAHPEWERWEKMDAAFNETFNLYADRPLELEAEAERLLQEALADEDCEQALVAQSLGFRAQMMLQRPADSDDWQLQLPAGCGSHYPRIQYDIANRLLQADEPDQAEARLLSITNAPKWASHAWNLVGMIRLNRNDLDGAMVAYMEAQAAMTDIPNPSIYLNLGQIAARGNAWAEALYWFGLASEAQTWNEHRHAYTFVYDIRPILNANLLRSAINAQDTVAADAAWREIWPTELTDSPLMQVRPMLDYLFWRKRNDLIPGVVRFYESVVLADSADAESQLNDRVLLFEPWRRRNGWSLERAVEVLSIAERNDALRMEVPNGSAPRDLPRITFARVMWLQRAAWGLVAVAMGWALLEAGSMISRRLARRRAEAQSNGELIDHLLARTGEKQGAAGRWEAVLVLASRLTRIDVENVIPEELLKRLSLREIQILRWILVGHSSQSIAEELDVTVQYVYNMRSELRRKLEMAPGDNWAELLNDPA